VMKDLISLPENQGERERASKRLKFARLLY